MLSAGQQPRLVILTSTPGNLGGMERLALNIARMFARRGWQTRCIFPATEKSEDLLAWSRQQGIEAETTSAFLHAEEAHTFAAARQLRQALSAWRPTVLSIHYPMSLSLKDLLAVRLAGVRRCVATLHCVPEWDVSRQRTMTRIASWLVDAVIVHSHPVKKTLIEAGVPARKIIYISPGLHLPENAPTQQEARARLGLPPGAYVIGTHARLTPVKGVAGLLEAVSHVPAGDDGPYLLVAGDGPSRSELAGLAATYLGSRVRFLGQLGGADLADFYASLDVFALAPVWQEAFGLVYVEAAQFGVPSVGWRVGGVTDAVVDGETGLLVQAGDMTGLAQALARLHTDTALRKQLGEAAQARAYREFTETHMADEYARVFGGAERPARGHARLTRSDSGVIQRE